MERNQPINVNTLGTLKMHHAELFHLKNTTSENTKEINDIKNILTTLSKTNNNSGESEEILGFKKKLLSFQESLNNLTTKLNQSLNNLNNEISDIKSVIQKDNKHELDKEDDKNEENNEELSNNKSQLTIDVDIHDGDK